MIRLKVRSASPRAIVASHTIQSEFFHDGIGCPLVFNAR
jgi:hypothetical protein